MLRTSENFRELTPYEEQLVCAFSRTYRKTWRNYQAGRCRQFTRERIEHALRRLGLEDQIRQPTDPDPISSEVEA
jgi:hypothetical protein